MARTNFTECGARYMNSPDLTAKYNYSGEVRLIPANQTSQITLEGCRTLCGTGNQWYPWSTTSATITTWVLPVIGTLLQAPFESNAFWRTVKAINRWIGSPISSLACILLNIEISGKCALYVDMALSYEEPIPDEHSDYASIRDSFYILMNMNQYKMKPVISMTKEAEGLLRIVLFSKDLKLIGTKRTLGEMRAKIARDLRGNRRRGVVPVFISTLWFLVALGISIDAAFGDVGSNQQAHDLAFGLFLCWFPILILCSILDKNPVAADDIQRKLNKMVDLVCTSLEDEEMRKEYIGSFQNIPKSEQMAYWIEQIASKVTYIKDDYFCGFAGQARTRFHYGAAYAILADIEKSYLAEHGRNWLRDAGQARAALVLGQVDHGFVWFDGRQMWQVLAAVTLVGGTGLGAFVLSFHTPTVGLGCRTGGYLIFFIVALCLLIAEVLVWWLTSPLRKEDQFHSHVLQYTQSPDDSANGHSNQWSFPGLASSKRSLSRVLKFTEEAVVSFTCFCVRMLPFSGTRLRLINTETKIRHHFQELHSLTTRCWLQRLFFSPLEFANMVWLCYIQLAQTIGGFNNCTCMTSSWGGFGGYMDFTQWNHADSPFVMKFWVQGTVITCSFMGLGMLYIVMEWLLQAHLSSESYKDAAIGLRRVRRFRRMTFWARYPSAVVVVLINNMLSACKMR